jgi:hypothetical protein
MADPAIAQVEDALSAQIGAYPALADWTVRTDGSKDIAIDPDELGDVLNVYTVAYAPDQSDEQHSTFHEALIEVEAVGTRPMVGTISRAVHTALAHVVAAVAADRSLGGLVQDIQEIDVAPSGANGKDVGSASLQFKVQFYTSRSDWFTILS